MISVLISSIRAARRSSFSIPLLANGEAWNEEREAGAAFSVPRMPGLFLSVTQVNEIIAAIVRPRRRNIGRAFIISQRFLQTIADRIDSIFIHAEADQKVFRSASAAITQ